MRVLTSLSAGALAVLAAAPALAAIPFQLASPPLPAAPGQEFTLCAANVGRKAQVIMQFVNVRTNAVVAGKSLILSAPGGDAIAIGPNVSIASWNRFCARFSWEERHP